uniref:Uncharacterized protein n=1 Tax=Anguilla anguilla TaxID=7936 RepID=A0A0E9V9M0_ANGAN
MLFNLTMYLDCGEVPSSSKQLRSLCLVVFFMGARFWT